MHHLPEQNAELYRARPAESWGNPLELLKKGGASNPEEILKFFRSYPKPNQRRSEVVLVVPTSSSVVKREILNPDLRNLSFDELRKLPATDWEAAINYDKSFVEKQRVTTEMGILTLMAVLLGLSEGRFPVTYVSALCEGVIDRFILNCYPVHEFDNGDIVLRYGLTPQQIKTRIAELNPRIVGINCLTTSHHNDCLDIAKIVRKIDPNIKIIVGGVHPTALDEYFAKHPNVDAVCRGEGDVTLPELIYCFLNDHPIKNVLGITYQEIKQIIKTPPRPLVHPDLVPWFLREAIPTVNGKDVISLYGLWNNGELVGKSTTMQSSRGCGFSCNYCASGQILFRHRSVDNIISELEYLILQGFQAISDETDQVVLPVPVFKKYCKQVIDRHINKRIKFFTPNGLLLDGLWKLGEDGRQQMLQAGYRDLCLAVEGSTDYVESVLNRKINVDLVPSVCKSFRRLAKELGIEEELTIRMFTQPGAPGETQEMRAEIIQLAQDWVKKGYIDHVISFISTSISGTNFFERTMSLLLQKSKENPDILILDGLIPVTEIWALPTIDDFQVYELFERFHIWTRFRFGLTNFSNLFDMSTEQAIETAKTLENLTPNQLKWF